MACVVKLVEASATYVYGHPMDQNQINLLGSDDGSLRAGGLLWVVQGGTAWKKKTWRAERWSDSE